MFVDILLLTMSGITILLFLVAVFAWVNWKIKDWMLSTIGSERSEG